MKSSLDDISIDLNVVVLTLFRYLTMHCLSISPCPELSHFLALVPRDEPFNLVVHSSLQASQAMHENQIGRDGKSDHPKKLVDKLVFFLQCLL